MIDPVAYGRIKLLSPPGQGHTTGRVPKPGELRPSTAFESTSLHSPLGVSIVKYFNRITPICNVVVQTIQQKNLNCNLSYKDLWGIYLYAASDSFICGLYIKHSDTSRMSNSN